MLQVGDYLVRSANQTKTLTKVERVTPHRAYAGGVALIREPLGRTVRAIGRSDFGPSYRIPKPEELKQLLVEHEYNAIASFLRKLMDGKQITIEKLRAIREMVEAA